MTLIEPGMVDTPFFDNRPSGALEPDDIARAVMFALAQPAHVDVNEILIRPIDQARRRRYQHGLERVERLRIDGFTPARRGYDRREVDKFLGALLDWLETDAPQDLGGMAVKRKFELAGKSTAQILLTTENESEEDAPPNGGGMREPARPGGGRVAGGATSGGRACGEGA